MKPAMLYVHFLHSVGKYLLAPFYVVGGICFSYFAAPASYSSLEAIFMKDPVLVLNESRTPSFKDDNKIVNQTVTAWLSKELQK